MTQATEITAIHSDDYSHCDTAALMADLASIDESCITQDWDAGATTWEMEDGSAIRIEGEGVSTRDDDGSPWLFRGYL
jgi:hypothetical protein